MPATKLYPRYVEKIWGRTDVPDLPTSEQGKSIGELWFEGADAEPLPLLVKYIFTSERLSIQVHPNDAQGQDQGIAGGKEECWYVLEADADATIGIGTKRALSGVELREAAMSGEIETLMDWRAVKPGDFYFIPAGTVHAIGAGISLVEVQQNVDITYRLYDYGRPRELHLQQGVQVSKAAPYNRARQHHALGETATLLDRTEAPFQVEMQHLKAGESWTAPTSVSVWFIPLRGDGHIGDMPWQSSECWMLSGATTLYADSNADFLLATL